MCIFTIYTIRYTTIVLITILFVCEKKTLQSFTMCITGNLLHSKTMALSDPHDGSMKLSDADMAQGNIRVRGLYPIETA